MQHKGVWLVLLSCVPLLGQNPFAGNAAEAAVGRGIFRVSCAPCHGKEAQGGRGPDLSLGVFANGDKDDDLYGVISNGLQGTEMNGYERLGNENVWRLVAYIRSLTPTPGPPLDGDGKRGEAYFWQKGKCGSCHRVEASGGPTGPELTRVGRKRSLAYLRESITNPDADLTNNYYTIAVRTRDGKTIRGVERGYDNFSAQLLTATGEELSFLRSETASITREKKSLMPAYNLSPGEMNDLLVYLMTLRGETRQ